MRIGELAKLTGKSVAALRYYEQVGLLASPQRTEAGYREYSAETVERVRFIVHAQERSFSLREIKTILALSDKGRMPCASVAKAACKKVERLEKRIAQLQARRALLVEAVRLWDSGSLESGSPNEAPFCPMLNVSESNQKEANGHGTNG